MLLGEFFKKVIVNLLWNLLGRKRLVRLARFLSNQSRLDIPNDMSSNGEIPLQRAIILEKIANKKIIFDVGAHIGEWSKFLLNQSKILNQHNIVLHVFEPSPESYRMLKKNLASINSGVDIIFNQLAISDVIGVVDFNIIKPLSEINSLIPIDESIVKDKIKVYCTSIDEYCLSNSVDWVYFIKVDTEGNDYNVIKSAKKLLEERRINYIQFEYSYRWIAFRRYLKDVFELCLPLGYHIGKITPKGVELYKKWHPELESFREGNYILYKNNIENLNIPIIRWWNE